MSDDLTKIANTNSDATVMAKKTALEARVVQPQKAAALDKTQLSDKTHLQLKRKNPDNTSGKAIGVGDIIKERFILDKMLGKGGMGAVFRALDLRKKEAGDTKPYVALKLLGEDFKHHSQALVTLQREARKTQELAHPNIVTVYDFDRDGDLIYLTMEELKGESLDQVVSNPANILSHPQALDILQQIALGLAYAHSKGIVHSDLKPANIFLTDTGKVKVLDFGIARAAAVDGNKKNNRQDRYEDNFDAGDLGAVTFAYASNEMLAFEPPHPSDDIYALGIIACELFGKKHPYQAKDAQKVLAENIQPQLPPLNNPFLRKLLLRSIATQRKDRIQDAEQFLKQLKFARSGVKTLSIVAGILLMAAAGNFYYLHTYGNHEIAFKDLPVAAQQEFKKHINEANLALQFGDLQGAVVNVDQAFAIHHSQKEMLALRDHIVDILNENLKTASDDNTRYFYQQQIDQLNAYPAFVKQVKH